MEQLNLNNYNDIIILAPHPDDELLGCSSILFNKNLKDKISIMYLTDGCFYDYPNIRSKRAAEIRKKELTIFCKYYGFNYHYCGIKDSHLNEHFIEFGQNLTKVLQEKDWSKTMLLIPHSKELHDDHSCIEGMLQFYLNTVTKQFDILRYEVWTPMLRPKYYLKINPVEKERAMNLFYSSQMTKFNYVKGILGLNRYRGLQMLCNSHFEAFS